MKDYTCSKVWFARWILILSHTRPITCTCVFERLILWPSWELVLITSETKVWRSSSDSAKIAMSSAHLRLLIIVQFMQAPRSRSWSACNMATSSKILKSCGEMMQPCLTPTLVENQSVKEPFTLTALWDWLYKACWCQHVHMSPYLAGSKFQQQQQQSL